MTKSGTYSKSLSNCYRKEFSAIFSHGDVGHSESTILEKHPKLDAPAKTRICALKQRPILDPRACVFLNQAAHHKT